MSKERLEEIKDKYMDAEYDFNLNKHDINWLIEQAGLEQSHSEKIDELHIFLQDNIKIKDGYLGMHVIDVAIEGIKGQNKRIRDLEQKIRVDSELFDMLEQQNKRYREALDFYAEDDNYGYEVSYRPQPEIDCMVLDDRGYTARQALEGEE